ncbi:antibiotic biosynthesis monooxygenase family protein [Methylomonas sp. MgM2]
MIDMRNLFYVYSAMILEIAQLKIRPGQTVEFENAFKRAQTIIASMPGYIINKALKYPVLHTQLTDV